MTKDVMTIDAAVKRIADGKNLLDNLGLLEDISTWETSIEAWNASNNGAAIEGISTANMGIYRLFGDDGVFDLLGRDGNLFIDGRFRNDAYLGISQYEFFFPQDAMKRHVMDAIDANKSLTVRYSGLRVKTDDLDLTDYGYIELDGKNTDEEKKLFSGVYGVDNPGTGIRVYILREDVVREQLRNRPNDLIVRECCFGNCQDFDADGGLTYDFIRAVRGVRRVPNVDHKRSIMDNAYKTTLASIGDLTESQLLELYKRVQPRLMSVLDDQMRQRLLSHSQGYLGLRMIQS